MRNYDGAMLSATELFVKNYQKENGRSPSLRTIGKAYPRFYGNSVAKVQRYVQELCRRGLLEYGEGNGIKTAERLFSGKTRPTSLVGSCPCGKPMLAVENVEGTYALPTEIFGSDYHFMLRAVGYSMIDAGIEDGDLMVVREQNYADAGQIIIALINDEATAKVYLPLKNKVVLRVCNGATDEYGERVYADIVTKQCEILGVVDKVIHTPRAK